MRTTRNRKIQNSPISDRIQTTDTTKPKPSTIPKPATIPKSASKPSTISNPRSTTRKKASEAKINMEACSKMTMKQVSDAIQICSTTGDFLSQVNLLYFLSLVLSKSMTKGQAPPTQDDVKNIIQCFSGAAELAHQQHCDLEGPILADLAYFFHNVGLHREAVKTFESSLNIFVEDKSAATSFNPNLVLQFFQVLVQDYHEVHQTQRGAGFIVQWVDKFVKFEGNKTLLPSLYLNIAELLYKGNKYKDCIPYLDKGMASMDKEKIDNETVALYSYFYGWSYLHTRNFVEAIPHLEKYIDLASNSILAKTIPAKLEAHRNLAIAYHHVGKIDKSKAIIVKIEEILKTADKTRYALPILSNYYILGAFLSKNKRLEKGKEFLLNALNMAKTVGSGQLKSVVEIAFDLGDACHKLKEREEAISYFNMAFKGAKGSEANYLEKYLAAMQITSELGRKEDACKVLIEGLEHGLAAYSLLKGAPGFLWMLRYLRWLIGTISINSLGRIDEARTYLDKAIEDENVDAEMQAVIKADLACCAFQEGDFDKSQQLLDEAISAAQSPTVKRKEVYGDVLLERADRYFHLGDYTRAVNEYKDSEKVLGADACLGRGNMIIRRIVVHSWLNDMAIPNELYEKYAARVEREKCPALDISHALISSFMGILTGKELTQFLAPMKIACDKVDKESFGAVPVSFFSVYLMYAKVLVLLGQFDEARGIIDQCTKVLDERETMRKNVAVTVVYQLAIAELQVLMGDYAAAGESLGKIAPHFEEPASACTLYKGTYRPNAIYFALKSTAADSDDIRADAIKNTETYIEKFAEDDKRLTAWCRYFNGVAQRNGKQDEAKTTLEQSMEGFVNLNDVHGELLCRRELAIIGGDIAEHETILKEKGVALKNILALKGVCDDEFVKSTQQEVLVRDEEEEAEEQEDSTTPAEEQEDSTAPPKESVRDEEEAEEQKDSSTSVEEQEDSTVAPSDDKSQECKTPENEQTTEATEDTTPDADTSGDTVTTQSIPTESGNVTIETMESID